MNEIALALLAIGLLTLAIKKRALLLYIASSAMFFGIASAVGGSNMFILIAMLTVAIGVVVMGIFETGGPRE